MPENRKTFWTGGNFAPWTSYVLDYQDNDNGHSQSKVQVGRQNLQEGRKQEVVAQSHSGLSSLTSGKTSCANES